MPFVTHQELNNPEIFSSFPFQFSEAYARFTKANHGNEILFFEFDSAYIPFEIFGKSNFKQIKILSNPCRDGIKIKGESLQIFLNTFIEALKKEQLFIRVVQQHPIAFTNEKPNFSTYCDFGTYITYLENISDDELLDKMDVKYKKAIQHSIKNNGTVLFGNNELNSFYSVYKNTCIRAGIHYDSLAYFTNLINYLPDNTCIACIYDENQNCIGSAFFIFDKKTCYCTHAGSVLGSKLYGGMKHLHFEAMKYMRDNGVNSYDLTGVRINSKNETLLGIFKFKEGFGGELVQGYLWKTDLIKWKCRLYDFLLLIKLRGKRMNDIIDQENN